MKPSQPRVRKFEPGMMETILRRELAALGYELRGAHGGKNVYNLIKVGQRGRPRRATIRELFEMVNPVRVKRGDEPLTTQKKASSR